MLAMKARLLVVAAAAACGMSGDRFVYDLAEAHCGLLLECSSEAVLTFHGWTDLQACLDDRGPEIAALGDGCAFDPKAARECVEETQLATCPPSGEEVAVAASCATVYECE
jgi:hypothetical protein